MRLPATSGDTRKLSSRTMAAEKAALASGADLGDGLRKRQVASPGAPSLNASQPDDKKKLAKKVIERHPEPMALLDCAQQGLTDSGCRRNLSSKCLQI